MTDLVLTSQNIEKIGHPVKEIRERALTSLISKLNCDYVFDDSLNRSNELLKLLFKWFQFEESAYQDKVLDLMLSILKSNSGSVFINHYGCRRLLHDLSIIEPRIDSKSLIYYNNIINYLSGHYGDATNIPELDLPRSIESLVDVGTESSDTASHFKENLEEDEAVQEIRDNISINRNSSHFFDERNHFDLYSQGIKIYLMSWCNICDSDVSIIKMIENSYNTNESLEKTLNFFSNILLRDFPAELFLNRPSIVNGLFKMLSIPHHCTLAIDSLRSLFKALNNRLYELKDLDFRHSKAFINSETNDVVLNQDVGIKNGRHLVQLHIDGEEALQQIPLPVFCLKTIYTITNCLGECAVQPLTSQNNDIFYSMYEMNEVISLCFDAYTILNDIITPNIWEQETTNIFIEKIYQNTVIVMRSLGDILKRFRLSFTMSQNKDPCHRISYLRLMSFGILMFKWCNYSPLVPSSFTSSLYEGLFDVSTMLLYRDLHSELKNALNNFQATSIQDKEKLNDYLDCEYIYKAMQCSVEFINNYRNLCESPAIIKLIRDSLPALSFHLNMMFVARVMDVFSVKCLKWKLSKNITDDMRFITLSLLAHSNVSIKEMSYTMIHSLVGKILSGDGRDLSYKFNENSISFLMHASIFTEIASHGIESSSKKVQMYAKDIIQYMLRGKLLLSNKSWRLLLESLIPTLPFIHVHADHNNAFGTAVLKTLDLQISEQMLIPKIDLILGNIRLLYTKCFTAQMEGATNIIKLLGLQEGSDGLLPKNSGMKADNLCSALRTLPPSNFNVFKNKDVAFYERGSMLQVLSLLAKYEPVGSNIDYGGGGDAGAIDPSFRRSALSQLAVMLQQPTLHEPFLSNNGCKIITHYLQVSLMTHEYTSFPECAMSCVTIFNILCYANASIRQWLSEQQDIILNIIRALLIFPNDETFPITVSQLLCLLSFAQSINNVPSFNSPARENFSGLSLHHCIAKNINVPFPYETYSAKSAHERVEKYDVLMSNEATRSFLRTCWCSSWYEGVENVVRWPYIPDNSDRVDSYSQALLMSETDLTILKMTCPIEGCVSSLYQIQNATSHKTVNSALDKLTGYMLLINESKRGIAELDQLPWQETMTRFTKSIPASPKDTLLLLNVIKCFCTFVDMLIENGCKDLSMILWIDDCIFDSTYGISGLLKQHECERNWVESEVDQTPNNLRHSIIRFICKYSTLLKKARIKERFRDEKLDYGEFVEFLTNCLRDIEIYNHYSLAFIGQIIRCLCHVVGLPCIDISPILNHLIQSLAEILTVAFIGDDYEGYKNTNLVKNCFVILCQLLQDSLGDEVKMKVWIENAVQPAGDKSILSACLLWYDSSHLILRTLSFKLLTGLCTQPAITTHLNQKFEDADQNLMEMIVNKLLDVHEATVFKEQATILLSNLLCSKLARHIGMKLFDSNFFEKISSAVTKVCLEDQEEYESKCNIPLEMLSNREALEVAYSKNEFTLPVTFSYDNSPKCSVKLLTSYTDMIYNYILYSEKIPDSLVDSGILRFLFRCIILKSRDNIDRFTMVTAICRLLHRTVNMSLQVHSTIVATEDCVSALFQLYNAEYIELSMENAELKTIIHEMWKWSLLLIGSIAETKNGFKLLWKLLLQSGMSNFFRIILLSTRDIEYKEVLPSTLFCLISLLSSNILYTYENDVINMQKVLDETPTSTLDVKSNVNCSVFDLLKDSESSELEDEMNKKSVKFDAKKIVLEDAVLGVDLCDSLLIIYKTTYNMCKNVVFASVNENPCYSITSCLCGLFATSNKSQLYAVDKGFIQGQTKILHELQYSMAAEVKASDIMKKITHPSLLQLDWSIQLLSNLMMNCPEAKEQCAEAGLVVPLNKMWPWCISTMELRQHVIQLLTVYTNRCSKANQTMQMTVGSRSLLQEVIDLVDKEMGYVSRQRSLLVLRGCLHILENTSSHVHCRAIILKADLLNNLNKLHPAVTKRQPQWREVEAMWESLVITLTRYPEGQLRVAEYLGTICALIHQAQGLMLPVLGNCAFNSYNRPRILGSAEVINIFSTILLSHKNIQDILIVCGALWAIGANHHKSKLALKTAGLTFKLSECLQKLKYTSDGSTDAERAIQIVTYVLKIITIL